ncbi:inositol monophosphatase family protein [Caldivirga sp.]|uniref:inositol monophosphatase family protein n=1 Tax=Caldivirga sp. TaxID=2080243 RepID=UPI0025C4BA38|nr:inositol monophosphatase family protein [Caldivirga sp.]
MGNVNVQSLLMDIVKNVSPIIVEKSKDPSYKRIMKSGKGDVTRGIDWVAEGAIIDRIKAEGLRALVITEERGVVKVNDGEPDYLFIVDPIDGSLNFVLDVPFYSISIATAKFKNNLTLSDVEAGIIHHVNTGVTYYAEKGKGAFINGEPASFDSSVLDKPVASIYIEPTVEQRVLTGLAELYRRLNGFKIRSLGAASLEITMAALGKLLFFLDVRNRLRLYDIAAAYVMAKELNSIILAMDGYNIDDVPINEQPRVSLLVTRSREVAELLKQFLQH